MAAANSKSGEVALRAMQILETLYRTAPCATHEKVQVALEKLAQGSPGLAADRASELIKPSPAPLIGRQGVVVQGAQIQIGGNVQLGGNLQVIALGGGNANLKVRIQNINGRRIVDADEGARVIHIEDDPQSIEVKVTQTVQGNQQTTVYTVKTLDTLKKNHPEAAKIYDRYLGNGALGLNNVGAQLRLQVQAQVAPGQAIPVPVVPQPNIAPQPQPPKPAGP